MISPKSPLLQGVFLFISLIVATVESSGQCNPPDQLPTQFCNTAPLVCLNNACYSTLNQPLNCCTGFCGGGTAVHNPQYFAFVPIDPTVAIHIHVNSCTSGLGLQSVLLGACPWTNSDVLDCAQPPQGTPPGGIMVLNATGLIVGETYWLMIDGSTGATCEYTIEFVSGIFTPGLDNDVTAGQAVPDYVCQGYVGVQLVANPPVGNAHGYLWELEWSGEIITTTLNSNTINIPTGVPPGIYDICVTAFSGCDTMDMPFCFPIEVYAIPDEIKPTESFCPEEFPFSWGSVSVGGPGTYNQTFMTSNGCRFDSTWTVLGYPAVPVGQLDTLHCQESLIYEGNAYDAAGTYMLSYPGMGLNGCDSTAQLNVTLAAINAFVELTCQNGEFVLTPHVQDLLPFNANIDWQWFENGNPVWDNMILYTLTGGTYSLEATIHTPAGNCTFFIEQLFFDEASYRPGPPNMGFVSTQVCAQEGVFFQVIVNPLEGPFTYVWSGPANVPINQNGSHIAEFDFSNSGPVDICVYAINECGDGIPFCFPVDIIPSPVALFDYEFEVCAGATTVITFTGNAGPNAEVTWDFDSPTTITGTGLGPYSLSWANTGTRVVTLTVIEPGCDTAIYSQVITLSDMIPPVINCTSTLTSVDFNWNDVVGASGYLVSIDGAAPVPTAGSSHQVGGLTPGQIVEMILTVVSGGPCPNIIDTAYCTAQDCPPPVIVVTGQDSSCLNNPTIIDLDATVNGSPGTGVWSGPGIIDADLGLFDPRVAMAGQHQIIFTATVGGCPFNEPHQIIVFDSIRADFTIDPQICITDVAVVTYTGNGSSNASYNYTFAPAMVVSGTGEGPYQLRWATPGPKTVRLQVSEHGCMSDIISRNIDVVASLNPPVVNCIPNTSGVAYSWTIDPAASGRVINILSGQTGNPVGQNGLEFTGLNPGDIVELEIITQSAGPCPERRDTFPCEARECPPVMLSISQVNDICLYPGTGVIDLVVTVTNGNGSGSWSGPGIIDAVNGRFSPVVAGAGSHQVTYQYIDDGCDFFESIMIRVDDPPTAFISNTNLVITCASNSLTLDGSASSGGTLSYLWTTSNGTINSGHNTSSAVAGAAGVYQLLVTNTVSGCKDSTSVAVTLDASIPVADAGPDATITCDNTVFVLGGNSSSGVNIIYTWSTPDGNIVGPSNGTHITVDRNGEYMIVVRDTTTGCESSDRAIVGIDTAVATLTLTPGETIDCDTPISTAQSSLTGPASDYTFQWSTTDGVIEGSSTGQTLNVSQGGTYTLTIENIMNGCQTSEDVLIDESNEMINAVDVSLLNIVCHGQNNGALVINSVDGGTGPYTYQWSVSPQGGTSLSSLGPGQYTLTVTDANGCTLVQQYLLTQPDLVTLDIGPNKTVAGGDSVSLRVTTNLTNDAIGNIEWGGYEGLFCPGCPVFEFIAGSSATITAMISDTAGCIAVDSMRLTVLIPRIFYIPTIFSPNGDNINDYFTISGRPNLINIGFLRIFDRWGNLVFQKENLLPGNEMEGWDGRFKGEVMLPGVYVFVAQLDYEDRSETITGEVTLVR